MPSDWDARGDFADVVDTLETVTLVRRGGDPAGEAKPAWRFSETAVDPVGPRGEVRRVDLVWQLPAEAGVEPPRPGDMIRDSIGRCGVVRSVTRLRGQTRHSCLTRRVELSPLAAERFRLERPRYEDSGQGPTLVGWDVVLPGVVAVVDPEGSTPAASRQAYLVRPIPALVDDVLRGERDGDYQVTAAPGAASIGDPFVLELVDVA